MTAAKILVLVAVILIAAAVRDVAQRGWQLGPAARTWLLVAGIFVAVALYVGIARR
jgi:hypothetical protein